MSEDFGRILNQFTGGNRQWNYVRNAAVVISPEYGKRVYDGSQLLLGVYGVGSGIGKLTAETVYTSKNLLGYVAVDKGKNTWTYVGIDKKGLEVSKWTENNIVVNRLVVNPELVAGTTLGGLALDTIGMNDALNSVRENMEENK